MIHCNIFLVGGFDQLNPIKSVKRFDLLSKTLINIASLNNCGGYLAIAAFDDYLYAAGGNKTTDLGLEAVNYFELYDHIKDKWVDLPIMKIKRSNFQLVALNNSFFAIGGRDSNFRALSSVEKYDVKNKK
jgi:hypothetical protein